MTRTTRYILRRVFQNTLILFLVSILGFALVHLAPGGPGQFLNDPRIGQADIDALHASYGLNEPLPTQYMLWMSHWVRGDWGRSFVDQRPVLDKIAERLPATLLLNLATLLIGLLGIPLGVLAAARRGSLVDRAVQVFNALANSLPHWWLGLLILLFVAAPSGLLPLGGMYTVGKENDLLDRLWHLILPATLAALGDWILYSRYLRASLLEVIHQDYVRAAYSKGLRERAVLWRHAFRNALVPVVPLFVFSVAGLVSGSVIYENTFAWPGIGRLAVQAAFQRDYPVVMALMMLGSFITVVGVLVIDLLYPLLDPRVRYD